MRLAEYMGKACDPKTLTVHQIMEDAVFTCTPETAGVTVAQVLTERNFGSVPVVTEDKTLVGLISEFDLLKAMTDGKDLRKITAGDIMTPQEKLVTVTEETPVLDLIKILQERHLIRVPVVKGKTLVGIVARRDVVFGYVKALARYWP
ncbi:MAG: CBS domain-containing protein [Nitrospirales bacterium]|nr:CBS domain-containing protein [Nitrospirales bacterium]